MAFQTSGSGGTRFAPMSEINVTPMVDVMLVLLVIFMVTAPMMMQGIDVDLPKADAKSIATNDKELTLSLTKDGRYLLGVEGQQNEIEPADLATKIKTNPVLQAQKKIFLQVDKSLAWKDIAPVMALLEKAGISNIGMITEPGNQHSN